MAINKVKYGETTLIDLTGTTATSNTILQGYGAYGKDGVWIDGIAKQNTGMESVTQDQDGFVILDDDEGNQIAVNPLSVTENGTYTAATGNAYNPVTVNVPSPDFIVTLTKNSNDEWEPDCTFAEAKAAYDAGKTIMSYAGIEYITNIAYNEELDAFFYVVNILGTNVDSYQYKWSAEGIELSFYTKYYQTANSTATPSDVLSGKSFYNSSGRQTGTIATKSSSNLTVSGATVTAPAGYYSTAASKSVATGSATAPSSISGTSATVSTGTNTLTLSKTVSVTPSITAGYISSGTAGNANVSLTANVTVNPTPTASGKTVTTPAGYYTTSKTTDVASGSATTPTTTITANPTISVNSSGLITATTSASQNITPTVSAGYVSSGTAGTVSVSGSNTQQLTTKGATTYTPSTTAQTIASGTYLTGTQTISGDANLVAENIKKDVSIFGVTGTLEEGGRKKFYATIVDKATYPTGGHSTYCYVTYPDVSGTKYYTIGDKFEIIEGELLFIHVRSVSPPNGIWINNVKQATNEVTYIVPPCTNITIDMHDEYDDGQRDDTIYLTEEPSDAIINIDANGTYNVSNYDIANVNVPTGGSSVESKDVNFYDYDGTLLYSYTVQEFNELSALPPNPTHEGLTSQGWNISDTELASAKQLVNDGLKPKFGQYYITDDGKTRLYVLIEGIERPLSIQFGMDSGMSVTIDWGDDSQTETTTSTTAQIYTHTYSSVGSYCVSLSPTGTGNIKLGLSSLTTQSGVMGSNGTSNIYNLCRLKKVEFGTNVSVFGANVFNKCYNLESVTVPYGFSNVSTQAFMYCVGLKALVVPGQILSGAFQGCTSLMHVINGITPFSLSSNAFYNCYGLTYFAIPDSTGLSITIGSYAFYNCFGLVNITIPSHVGSIESTAFRYCGGLKEIHIKASTPPTVGTNAFNGIPSDCIMYVPQGCLETYQTAEGWSAYANYMQEEPA